MTDEENLIILADDDENHRFLFERAFLKVADQQELLVFSDGFYLMEYLRDIRNPLPRLIFIDIHMPLKNGLECLKEIREDERCKRIPVIVCTTSHDISDERQAILYQADMFIRKTGDPEELRYIIGRVLRMEWIEKLLRPHDY
ncbi:MAG: response regulator [Omnitrophica WOR_2 bacterium]|jgi:CheY-like chemotaxis protein